MLTYIDRSSSWKRRVEEGVPKKDYPPHRHDYLFFPPSIGTGVLGGAFLGGCGCGGKKKSSIGKRSKNGLPAEESASDEDDDEDDDLHFSSRSYLLSLRLSEKRHHYRYGVSLVML